ncbi:MAG: hypothetical protein GY795_15530 [Desulfobacterales bacterium]|nr:hypothetical protein [Desulfobacterales bacterium]
MNSKSKIIEQQRVNRALQIGKIRKTLYSLSLKFDELHSVVFNWFGIPGIGKTTLSLMIADICREISVPFARIDFNPDENQHASHYKNDYILILDDICTDLGEICTSEFSEELDNYRKLQNVDLKQKQSETVIASFHEHIKELTEKPLVILFDTTEKADGKLIRWIEDNIISPFCVTGRCVIVWTGRFAQQWKRFEVRRRVKTEKLEPLDPQSTHEQVGDPDSLIYHLTFGYPLGNIELAKVIDKYDTKPDNLIKALAENVIDPYVFKNIPEDLKAACKIMSVVRQFDVIILERLLCEFAGEFFNEETVYMKVMSELAATAIVEWNPIRKGYALDETMRRILMLHMKLNSQDAYLKIAGNAVDIYEEWIDYNTENRGIYIKEKFFHLISIGICKNMPLSEIIEDCQNALKKYLGKYYRNDPMNLSLAGTIQLYEEFSSDKELQEISGKKNIEELLKVTESHRQFIGNRN